MATRRRNSRRFASLPSPLPSSICGPWAAAYPEARLLAAPGLPEKRRDLRFHGVLADAPDVVPGEVEQAVVAGVALMGEVVFWNRTSRTLFLTDLVFNMRRASSALARAVFALDGAYGRFAVGRLERLLVRDRAATRAAVDRIVLAHGDVVERDGRALLRDAFAWL